MAGNSGGADEVSLKNGGMLRGTVVAVEPGNSVTIVVYGTGEKRTISWDEVEDITQGKYGSDEKKPADSEQNVSPDGEDLRLHVEADDPAVKLYRHLGSSHIAAVGSSGGSMVGSVEHYEQICQAPCDMAITEPNGEYFYAGDGILPSETFNFQGRQGDTGMSVLAGPSAPRVAGKILTFYFGIPLTIGGTTAMVLGFTLPNDGATGMDTDPWKIAGGVMLGVGATALVTGLVLWATSDDTEFSFDDAQPVAFGPNGLAWTL